MLYRFCFFVVGLFVSAFPALASNLEDKTKDNIVQGGAAVMSFLDTISEPIIRAFLIAYDGLNTYFLSVAQGFVAIGCVAYSIYIYNQSIRNKIAVEFSQYMRVLLVFLGMFFYRDIVSVMGLVQRGIMTYIPDVEQRVENVMTSKAVMKELDKKWKEVEPKPNPEDDKAGIFSGMSKWAASALKSITFGAIKVVVWLSYGFRGIAFFLMRLTLLSNTIFFEIEKLLLYVMGIISISISLFPLYHNAWKSWFQGLVVVLLAQIIVAMIYQLYKVTMLGIADGMTTFFTFSVVNVSITGVEGLKTASLSDVVSLLLWTIILILIFIIGYGAILLALHSLYSKVFSRAESIAARILGTSGDGGMNDFSNNSLQQGLNKEVRSVGTDMLMGTATGGTSILGKNALKMGKKLFK